MQDIGYFGGDYIELDTVVKGKKVVVKYSITSKGQYFIREIIRPVIRFLLITHLFKANEAQTLLKTAKPYNPACSMPNEPAWTDLCQQPWFF
ncbi:MAG: hypothetical protein R2788_03110 [Saprospiraceae bacterium]